MTNGGSPDKRCDSPQPDLRVAVFVHRTDNNVVEASTARPHDVAVFVHRTDSITIKAWTARQHNGAVFVHRTDNITVKALTARPHNSVVYVHWTDSITVKASTARQHNGGEQSGEAPRALLPGSARRNATQSREILTTTTKNSWEFVHEWWLLDESRWCG
ncbi:hypothetical protein CYMTET_8805 [Cymbomonas tetramitiformis]|uniref:Uncharacterized protein n=1 Tax=Cymbomonas tetramitiformis TaxID=36881 RepID=A0AAE0GU71_9CHLO|nr:hypothetical protein CYMTET_8805 [Cymbomonas tetramitiformis]